MNRKANITACVCLWSFFCTNISPLNEKGKADFAWESESCLRPEKNSIPHCVTLCTVYTAIYNSFGVILAYAGTVNLGH